MKRLRIKEQPVRWLNDEHSKVSFCPAAVMLFVLSRLAFLAKLKRYEIS